MGNADRKLEMDAYWTEVRGIALRTAQAHLGNAPGIDPEDVAQDTCINVMQGYRCAGMKARWRAKNAKRGEARRAVRQTAKAEQTGDSYASNPLEALVAAEDRERLAEAMKRLTPEQNVVVMSRFWFGMSIAETAAATGRTNWEVVRTIQAALQTLWVQLR